MITVNFSSPENACGGMPSVEAALQLYDLGLAVVPAIAEDGKSIRGVIQGHHRWRYRLPRAKTEELFRRHKNWTIALLPGLCRIPLVLADCDDEAAFEEAKRRYGPTPLVVRTPRGNGYHLYYRAPAEPVAQQNLRGQGYAIDIKAGRGAVAIIPPSVRPSSGRPYVFHTGSWSDLESLPVFRSAAAAGAVKPRKQAGTLSMVAEATRPATEQSIPDGRRNNDLFRLGLRLAKSSHTEAQLAEELAAENAKCRPPLEPTEIGEIARSAWKYEEEGRNWVGAGRRIVFTEEEMRLLEDDPAAFFLHAWMRLWHEGRCEHFYASPKAMAAAKVLPRWGHNKYRNCIRVLVERGLWRVVHAGGAGSGDASTYAFALTKGRTSLQQESSGIPEMRAA